MGDRTVNRSPAVTAPPAVVGRRLGRPDPAEEERRAEERQRVRDDGERRRERLHEQAADARAAHE
jgi:hypothetical protein